MSQNQSTYEQLRECLVSGEFTPGQRLRSEELRQSYGVSASNLREVLFRLSLVGLVDFYEQRGFRMPKQSLELQHDLTQTRMMLECEGACLSIRHGGVAWEARLNAAHHELKHIETRAHTTEKSKGFLKIWAEAELGFHRALIAACHSPLLQEFHTQVYHRFRQQMVEYDQDFNNVAINVEQHQRILEAALQHDEDLVRQRIVEHLAGHLAEPLPEKALPVDKKQF